MTRTQSRNVIDEQGLLWQGINATGGCYGVGYLGIFLSRIDTWVGR